METRQQRLIRKALEGGVKGAHERRAERSEDQPLKSQPDSPTSLREHAIQRTDPAYVPRTLTPYEWELYYAERGVPEAHRPTADRDVSVPKSTWGRFLQRLASRFNKDTR